MQKSNLPPPRDFRDADGEVPLCPLCGVDSITNEVRPELKRFLGLTTPGEPSTRGRHVSRRWLLGRVAVFSIFVGRDGSLWSDREIQAAYDAMERMGRWIEREAIRHAAPVNIELVDTYFAVDDPREGEVELSSSLDPYETIIDEAESDLNDLAGASAAVKDLGFADLADLIGQMSRRAEADAVVWIIHVLRCGRSCVEEADRFGDRGVGVALCYAKDSTASGRLTGLPFVDPATLAHETLHLFGATDKYGTPVGSFPPRSVTSLDVMRLDETRLSRCRIDPLTAKEIGWPTAPNVAKRKRPRPE